MTGHCCSGVTLPGPAVSLSTLGTIVVTGNNLATSILQPPVIMHGRGIDSRIWSFCHCHCMIGFLCYLCTAQPMSSVHYLDVGFIHDTKDSNGEMHEMRFWSRPTVWSEARPEPQQRIGWWRHCSRAATVHLQYLQNTAVRTCRRSHQSHQHWQY